MVNRKTFLRLIVLAAALCLVLVGISCKKSKPTEGNEIALEKPDDKDNVITNLDGMLRPDQLSSFDDTMVNVRLLADSGYGAFYRAPVIITYGGQSQSDKKSMAIFMEKRWSADSVGDVGVDGKSKTDIVFMANDRGGDSLDYSKDYIVGGVSANVSGPDNSRASAVVFVHQNGTKISVVAAAGTGNLGTTSTDGSGKSEVKISTGDKGVNTINFGEWKDLNIGYTNSSGEEFSASDAILKYAQEKINGSFNAFYTRWGQGKIDGSKWILPLKLMERKSDNSLGAQAVLVLYSEDEGANWLFGPYMTLGESAGYNEATGLSVSGTTVRLALVPRNPGSLIGIATGTLEDCSQNAKTLTRDGQSSFVDSYNNFEAHKANTSYFINTRERSAMSYNSFIVNKKLTIAVLSDVDGLVEQKSMLMSRVSGSGSVAVLADDTIVTVAEEAFAENSVVGENRYNLVQRRFTKGYVDKRDRIIEKEEYYNPNLEAY